MHRSRTHLLAVAAAAILVVVAVPAAFALRATRGVPGVCTRAQLGVRSNGEEGAVGTIHGAWVFTNRSSTSCTLNGYPALQLYGRSGRPLPTSVVTDLQPGPSQVTLAPGASGTFLSTYSDIVSGGSDRCPRADVLQITGPGVTASHFLAEELFACDGEIHVSAVEPGVHRP